MIQNRSHLIKEWLKQKEVNVFQWPNESLDLNPISNVVEDVKWVVHVRKLAIKPVLKFFRKKEWLKFLKVDVQD